MYVRDARNRDEAWLLEEIEAMGLDQTAFRSRDYVIAVDEESNERAGFGRYRIHNRDDGDVCELTGIGVVDDWRGQGVGAHVVERLIDTAADTGFDTVYVITDEDEYLEQFGFDRVEASLPPIIEKRLGQKQEEVGEDVVALAVGTDAFEMPAELRERFKHAQKGGREEPEEPEEPVESPEDFGIDPDEATYKYDTGGE